GSNSQTKFVSSSYESTILDKRDVMIQLVIDVDTNLIVAKLRTKQRKSAIFLERKRSLGLEKLFLCINNAEWIKALKILDP
ncbi:MAG: hypothetical protein QXJ24_06435, partial [Thermoplasmatales archaeon]